MRENKKIRIELLAPARDAESGIEAINHGADAVYIGASKFGARSAASNPSDQISKLISHAHKFGVKVYITLNTLLFDHELENARKLMWQLYETGADAFIIQDMAFLEMEIPPLPLIASTQTHNNTAEKIKFLEGTGFSRVILARELSLKEIAEIRKQTSVELECFVHGALCVSYSGQCYLSHAMGGRSGNRGECAQPCRLPWTVEDSAGKKIIKNKHVLSLKDLNLSSHLEELVNSGITSFKIEGRLKDMGYIKNIVSYYRQKIDAVLNDKYISSSNGKITHLFTPDPEITFNRGYSNYFMQGRTDKITAFDTPKSKGKFIGIVKKISQNYFCLDARNPLKKGDGICFSDKNRILSGTNIINIENENIYPESMHDINEGQEIFRNSDIEFERLIKNKTAERKLNIEIHVISKGKDLLFEARDESSNIVSITYNSVPEKASDEKKSISVFRQQLSKSGNTIFKVTEVIFDNFNPCFIPVSVINEIRRNLLNRLEEAIVNSYKRTFSELKPTMHPYPEKELFYNANVSNTLSEKFYNRHGAVVKEKAFEIINQIKGKTVMTTRHCIRFSLGICPKTNKSATSDPLWLKNGNTKLKIEFDCKNCHLKIIY